ncbi:MAG: PHP domain-containing protein [Gemmatimonadetes bacterium]|nr:PHP domain-containing protein [Gemmatimonadota bacterium]NIR78919.1 PHP domain-containing protein [Gemmatimonadota bacterium]NIT87554.1 PHP domain-containing protein [Gemmatimonadota bacterium]NIU31422.1 PHP domain-containing protein [Gemmatimonadota bacterium]NIU36107.1 PHP domain-containing protein [Gemmatimonadota bacterium]
MRLDLHLHSTASDGLCSPATVVEKAVQGRLDVIALTDHDTAAGVPRARAAARGLPLHVIAAVEASSTWRGHDIHVLGYFVDPHAPAMRGHAERAKRLRTERMKEMLRRLGELGVEVAFEDVLEAAGPDRESLARPHLARALVETGHVQAVPEAFVRFIGDDGPAFVPTRLQEPQEAVAMILEAGGIPVWAHPPDEALEPLLPTLADAGLRGLEAYRPNHRPDQVEERLRWARRYGLLVSGGSDWHGYEHGPEVGAFYVTSGEVGELLEAGGM